ncbi:phage holin family protein [Metaclostridioides mangenotii]|uniref:phage holin family protein n=1 Tax=Metaclostridioides mangenotii TaxID=1540 RepID=UPI000AFC06F9
MNEDLVDHRIDTHELPEQLIILVVTLNVLGFACKSIPKLDDRYIPIVLLAIGIV